MTMVEDPVTRDGTTERPPDGGSNLQRWLLGIRYVLVEADHCSFANAYLPWRYPLGSLLMAAVAAALCGWFVHARAFLLLIGVGSVIGLGVIWPKLSLLAIRGHLHFEDRRTIEGTGTRARLVLTNYLPLGSWGLRLLGGDAGEGRGSVVNLSVVPGWRTAEFEFDYVPPVRGAYPIGTATLSTGFPFGLWEAERPLSTAGNLIVWPRAFPLGDIPEAAAGDRTREGLVLQNRAGHSGDFFGVRPYVRGDSLRRIHWPQSARCDRLIVCERQAGANLHLQIVVDVDPAVHGGSGPDGSREWAIRIAASLIEAFLNRGALIQMVVDERSITTGVGSSHRERLLDTLAKVPSKTSRTLGELLDTSPVRRFRDGLQVVITSDLALKIFEKNGLWRRGGRYIILHTSPFDGGTIARDETKPTPMRPWVEIKEALDVAGQFRRAWRGVLDAN